MTTRAESGAEGQACGAEGGAGGGLEVIGGVGGDVDPFGGDATLARSEVRVNKGAVAVLRDEAAAADRAVRQREDRVAGDAEFEAARFARVEYMRGDRYRQSAIDRGDGDAARHVAGADRAEDESVEAADNVPETDAEFGGAAERGVLAAECRRPFLPSKAVGMRRDWVVVQGDGRGGRWREGGDERAIEGERR